MYAPREIAARLFIDHTEARELGKSFPRRSIRGSVYPRCINAPFRASANSTGVEREREGGGGTPRRELAKITARFRKVHGSATLYLLRRNRISRSARHVLEQSLLFPLRVKIVFAAMGRSILRNHTRSVSKRRLSTGNGRLKIDRRSIRCIIYCSTSIDRQSVELMESR